MSNKVSVIIPAFNEEAGIEEVLQEIPQEILLEHEVIVVDDGSTDNTFNVARKYKVKVLRHEKNEGKVKAIFTGVNYATNDLIVLMDADYSYSALDIPNLAKEVLNGADLVIGSRFMSKVQNVPFLNRIGNRLFSLLISWVTGCELTDAQSGFRAFRKMLLKNMSFESKGLEFETEMTSKACLQGLQIVEFPIEYRKRIGESKLKPLADGFRMLKSIIRITNEHSSTLSKSLIIPGLLFGLSGVFFGLYSIWDYVHTNLAGHGYFPLLTVLLITLSVQLIGTGILANQVGRQLHRLEQRLRQMSRD